MNELSSIDRNRYARHFSLAEIGSEGQQKIKSSRVLCVGAGGLGSTALYYLAAAGIGTLGIIDPDVVDLSNLQRQILYTTDDVGLSKCEQAKKRLLALNPHLHINTYSFALNEENVFSLFTDYDLIIDATDNYTARYLINDACSSLNKPNIFAAILRFQGQCSVFCLPDGPCYRCLFPKPPAADFLPNCSEAGVLGVLPGIMGCLQATEALKWIVGAGDLLEGRLMTFDALKATWKEYKVQRHPQCPLCSRGIAFADLIRPIEACTIPEISLAEFQGLAGSYLLIDVRDEEEYKQQHMNGKLIPFDQLAARLHELDKNELIIVHCKSGLRSQKAVNLLQSKGFKQAFSLKGGIMAWDAAQNE